MSLWSDVRQSFYNPPDDIRPSLADLSRRFGPDYRIIKKMLANSEPPGYQMRQPRELRSLKPHYAFIQKILEDDAGIRRKQKHTAARIYERLCKERDYQGSDRSVRALVAKLKRTQQEVFIPLAQPMSKGQADLFEADVEMSGIIMRVYVFVMALAYSDSLFAMAFPFKKQEAWLAGHKHAFDFFGGIPKNIDFDNDRAIVSTIRSGHTRKMNDEFLQLVSHFCFTPHFCNIRRGNEKGIVENANKYIEQHFFTPIPKVRDFAELNTMLRDWCAAHLSTTAKGKDKTRGELLIEEQAEFLEIPQGEYDACVKKNRKADTLSLVHFQTNRYSVPDHYAGRDDLLLKGYWDRVEIYNREKELLATHPRRYGKYEESLNPLHYLETLSKKPGAIDHGRPFEKLQLPECFDVLRRRLESEAEMEAQRNKRDGRIEGGAHRGTRRFVEIVKLLLEFPLPVLQRAIEKSLRLGYPQFEVIKQYCYPQEVPAISVFALAGREHLAVYEVKKPVLGAYDLLLRAADTFTEGNLKWEEGEHGQTESVTGTLLEGVKTTGHAEGVQGRGCRLRKEEEQLCSVPDDSLRTGASGTRRAGGGAEIESGEISGAQNDGRF